MHQCRLQTSLLLIGILQFLNVQIVQSLQVILPLPQTQRSGERLQLSVPKPAARVKATPRRSFSAVYAENRNSAQSSRKVDSSENVPVNGSSGGVGGMMSMGSTLQSQLASAFSALDESDQYDAVLTGLCAKILDQPSMSGDQVAVALQDPIQLFQEMNSRKVKASGRSIMALIDVRLAN
jgi:hypothetical protein